MPGNGSPGPLYQLETLDLKLKESKLTVRSPCLMFGDIQLPTQVEVESYLRAKERDSIVFQDVIHYDTILCGFRAHEWHLRSVRHDAGWYRYPVVLCSNSRTWKLKRALCRHVEVMGLEANTKLRLALCSIESYYCDRKNVDG